MDGLQDPATSSLFPDADILLANPGATVQPDELNDTNLYIIQVIQSLLQSSNKTLHMIIFSPMSDPPFRYILLTDVFNKMYRKPVTV